LPTALDSSALITTRFLWWLKTDATLASTPGTSF